METKQTCLLCGKPFPDVTSGWYHKCLTFNIPIYANGCNNNFPEIKSIYHVQ